MTSKSMSSIMCLCVKMLLQEATVSFDISLILLGHFTEDYVAQPGEYLVLVKIS